MKSVAVIGAGPAGTFAAERLARAGLKTTLIDEKLAWEKPCGGGVTYKAYQEYPYLLENDTSKRLVHETVIAAPEAGEAKMDLGRPLLIYSRLDLNKMLIERADKAGAQLEKTRVLSIERKERNWALHTMHGTMQADYCVVAAGARNPLKNAGTEWTAQDTMSALGYFVEGKQEHIDIQFLPNLSGYIWVFPRDGHMSVGIGGKGEPAHALRARLERYMDERGIRYKGAKFYSHMLPSLASPGWKRNRISGEGWLAAGDAAGLVDPITGEGIYYAMKSGDLASRAVLDDSLGIKEKAAAYRSAIAREFSHDLEFASFLARRVFLGSFFFKTVPQRMVEFTRRSARFRALMQDLFAGTQPYLELRKRLLDNLNGPIQETFLRMFLERVIPKTPA